MYFLMSGKREISQSTFLQRQLTSLFRVSRQFEMCTLDDSINIPLERLREQLDRVSELSRGQLPVYCLCRRGVASAEATRIIREYIDDGSGRIHSVYNIYGGLQAWVENVDDSFPQY